jgi:hypothetical protein
LVDAGGPSEQLGSINVFTYLPCTEFESPFIGYCLLGLLFTILPFLGYSTFPEYSHTNTSCLGQFGYLLLQPLLLVGPPSVACHRPTAQCYRRVGALLSFGASTWDPSSPPTRPRPPPVPHEPSPSAVSLVAFAASSGPSPPPRPSASAVAPWPSPRLISRASGLRPNWPTERRHPSLFVLHVVHKGSLTVSSSSSDLRDS